MLVNENLRAFKALARSAKLVKAKFWRIFGFSALTSLALFIAAAVIMLVFWNSSAAYLILIFLIIGILTVLWEPYYSALKTVLYFDVRAREEQQSSAQAEQGEQADMSAIALSVAQQLTEDNNDPLEE